MPTQQLRERTQAEIDAMRPKHLREQLGEKTFKASRHFEGAQAQRASGVRKQRASRPGAIDYKAKMLAEQKARQDAASQEEGISDYTPEGVFFDPSARSGSFLAPIVPTAISPADAPVLSVASAVTPPPPIPPGMPASIIDLRIAVLEAIKAYRANPSADNKAALDTAHATLRNAISTHRAGKNSDGGGWGGWGGWGGHRHGRRHRGRGHYGSGRSFAAGMFKAGNVGPTALATSTIPIPAASAAVHGLKRGCGMMYADDDYADSVNSALAGTLESMAHMVGISSNIAHWEAGETPQNIYKKYAAWIPSLVNQANGLLAYGARGPLVQKGMDLYRIMNPLKNAFATGATFGSKDMTRLDDLVGATRAFKSDLEEAKAKYGWAPPVTEQLAPAVAAASSSDFNWLLLVPFGLIAAWMFVKK